MILAAMSIVSLVGLLFISYRKIDNIVLHGAEKNSMLTILLEFALAVIFLGGLLHVQLVTAYSAGLEETLLPDAVEASQYLFFGGFVLTSIFFLMVFELLFNFGYIGMRGRMSDSRMGK